MGETGAPYVFEPDELILGLTHQRLILGELHRLGVQHSTPEESDLLGLARVTLTDVDAAAATIVAQAHKLVPASNTDDQPAGESLDRVLWGLRQIFGATYARWSPTMGKNRLLGRVDSVGEVMHLSATGEVMHLGDVGPTASAPPEHLQPRAGGPGQGVRVGVLDTALYPHTWLAGGWSALYSDRVRGVNPPVAEGHATFITGLILNQAPGATVEVRSVLKPDGSADSWSVAQAIVEFGRSGLDVLNLSFACFTDDGQPPMVMAAAIDRLDPELVVVAAAGNHGNVTTDKGEPLPDAAKRPSWPAALDDVLAVGSADAVGTPSAFTPIAPWVDVHAPGEQLLSTYLHGAALEPGKELSDWVRWSGSSFAAALVSGAIAAGTVPGRVSGRSSMLNILRSIQAETKGYAAPLTPFLPLTAF